MSSTEQRKDQRVEFFMVPVGHAHFPVWVFKPEGDEAAHAGLIVNASQSGIQVLTDIQQPLNHGDYVLHVLAEDVGNGDGFRARVTRIWSEPVGSLYQRSGLAFSSGAEDILTYLETNTVKSDDHRWLRCTLAELPVASAVVATEFA